MREKKETKERLIAVLGGDIGGNWSAHCITRWPWFTVCFVVCAASSRAIIGGK